MNPIRSRRRIVSSLSDRVDRSDSPRKILPEVSSSRPARQCSSVDLPEPDGPMMAVKRPAGRSTDRSLRAFTAASPLPYTLLAFTARAATPLAAVVAGGLVVWVMGFILRHAGAVVVSP